MDILNYINKNSIKNYYKLLPVCLAIHLEIIEFRERQIAPIYTIGSISPSDFYNRKYNINHILSIDICNIEDREIQDLKDGDSIGIIYNNETYVAEGIKFKSENRNNSCQVLEVEELIRFLY